MRKTARNILGAVALVALSAGVAGVTTYKLLSKERPATFSQLFEQQPEQCRLAAAAVTGQQHELPVCDLKSYILQGSTVIILISLAYVPAYDHNGFTLSVNRYSESR